MSQQIRKDKKCCGTCLYWTGVSYPMPHTTAPLVINENGFYEKCKCCNKNSPSQNEPHDWQYSCSKWEQKFK